MRLPSLTLLVLILLSVGITQAADGTPPPIEPSDSFDPSITNLGFAVPEEIGNPDEQLEWVITVTNNGTVAGTNLVISDTVHPELRVDGVEISKGSSSINGQTVSVTIPTLAPGERVQISIFTTVLSGAQIDNTACVDAHNLDEARCVTSLSVRTLPETGELQHWRDLLLVLLLLFLSASLVRRARD